MNKRVKLALCWALVVGVMTAHIGWLWHDDRLVPDTDIMNMLPSDERDPVLQQAITHMASAGQQRLIVLVGAADWTQAKLAAGVYRGILAAHGDQFKLDDRMAIQAQQNWLDQFVLHRQALLTAEQRKALGSETTSYWVDTAQRQIYSPFGGIKVGTWQDDPFGLFGGWVEARAQETLVRPSDGWMRVDSPKKSYVVIPIEVMQGQAFSLSTQQTVMPLLQKAEQATRRTVPAAEIISAGLILHAAAAGAQANNEINTIGWGSLAGVLLLMAITFRSLKPIALVVLTIGIGCLGALWVCWLVFDQLHLLTLVFGASLVGVAEDYGIHYLCSKLDDEQRRDPEALLRHLMPGLTLAMLTTVVAYLALALTPFPGLRQMAVFSATGLIFAWLTVVCWFPVLDRGALRSSKMVSWYGRSRAIWPQLGRNWMSLCVIVISMACIVFGVSRLHTNDDIRLLQNSPPALIDAQIKVSELVGAPSLGQFYIVRGETEEQVLQHEEALKARLDSLVSKGVLSGYQAMSNWVPSQKQQVSDRELASHLLVGPDSALSQLAITLGESDIWATQIRVNLTKPVVPITPHDFLKTPASEAWRHLWLGKVSGGYASVVALRGVKHADLAILQATADGLHGVQWADKVEDISTLLGRYREQMAWVVLLSYGLVYLLLWWRYRVAAWRVMAPTVAASALTLAVFGFAGQSLNLFHVLALLLILGMGVDFGIFLQEHPSRQDKSAWFAVGLSAVSTLLSFGLLGLSKTPALQAFGLTMLMGVGIVWLVAPCFRTDK